MRLQSRYDPTLTFPAELRYQACPGPGFVDGGVEQGTSPAHGCSAVVATACIVSGLRAGLPGTHHTSEQCE